MKKLLSVAVLLLVAVSCKKTVEMSSSASPGYLQAAVVQLKDSLSPGDFTRLDTSRCFVTVADSGQVNYVRMAFRGVPVAQSFVLLHTDGQGKILRGRIVDLADLGSSRPFDSGSVTLRSLGGKILVQSAIWRGFVLAFHGRSQTAAPGRRTTLMMDAEDDGDDDDDDDGDMEETLPEAFVYPGGGGSDGGTYYSLSGLLGEYDGGTSYYGVGDPEGGGGGSSVVKALTTQAQAEYTNSLTVISLQNYFNCFGEADPDGATYTLQLCTDIPVNNDPGASYDLANGTVSSGHSFLVVTMANSAGVITQSFGFYPAETPAFWNPAVPVSSAIKDNGGHEINASVTISISAAQLASVQAHAVAYAANQYSLVYYNCTDYALDVFNSVSPTTIVCFPYNAYVQEGPSDPPTELSMVNSPVGLYNSLVAMKSGGGALAPAIQTDLSGNMLSPASHGACP